MKSTAGRLTEPTTRSSARVRARKTLNRSTRTESWAACNRAFIASSLEFVDDMDSGSAVPTEADSAIDDRVRTKQRGCTQGASCRIVSNPALKQTVRWGVRLLMFTERGARGDLPAAAVASAGAASFNAAMRSCNALCKAAYKNYSSQQAAVCCL